MEDHYVDHKKAPIPHDADDDDEVIGDPEMNFQDHKGCCGMSNKKESIVFVVCMLIGMLVGIGMGIGLRYANLTDKQIHYFQFPGEMFLRMLKMMILPLIMSSLIFGMANLKAAGWIGARTILYYMSTTIIAVVIGIILVVIIQPGYKGSEKLAKANRGEPVEPIDSLLDLIRNCFPDNILESTFRSTQSVYPPEIYNVAPPQSMNETFMNTTMAPNTTTPRPSYQLPDFSKSVPKVKKSERMNVLGIIVFCIIFGLCLGRLPDNEGMPLIRVFRSFNYAIMKMVMGIMWCAPIGIMFIIAHKIVSMKNPIQTLTQLGYYMMTVMVGLFAHGFIVLPIILLIFARYNPLKFVLKMSPALMNAFSTASSSATLPLTMRCLENNCKVDKRITGFVLPVGATINMDGTALYEAVAAIFIAQVNNIPLDPGQYVTISLTATAASIGAAGIPEAGLITMAIVLQAVGLPVDDIGLIFAIDWFLDRCRTTINVWGDSVGAMIVAQRSRKELMKHDEMMNDAYRPPRSNGDAIINAAYEPDAAAPHTRL
ncbi:unnamed protein product [Owenia fusiformis]|uniref:Amino acid transporter n=1 Tax=Owenia fusiformis TaxID=6347 RepID=A0A8J1XP20_OWEFU|nr:unnamed protein product [Owenia fusiformis]